MDYDFIIVGGGSAGCVTAGRLVSEHGARVLLLEAGTSRRNMFVDMPAGCFKIMTGPYGYVKRYMSVPQPSLDGRRVELTQGNILGGGSSVNAMAYGRGVRSDWDEWNEHVGRRGWGWDDMVPHFRHLEGSRRPADPTHGTTGTLSISDPANPCRSSELLMPTLEALGVPVVTDFNTGDGRGVGYFHTTTRDARRCSAANAFVDPLRGDSRLTLVDEAAAQEILFDGSGRAVGVEYLHRGETKRATCTREVILTAGAYVTPKLLMLSGIGPADELARHGITARVDLPGVGRNMQDHNAVPLAVYTSGKYGYFGEDRGVRAAMNFVRYKLFGKGPIASTGTESSAFLNLDDPSADPNLQIYNIPVVWLTPDQGTPDHGFTLLANVLQPKSRGWMRLRSRNPQDDPEISPNFLADPDDVKVAMDGFRFLREIARTRPFADMVHKEVLPGPSAISDTEIQAYCKASTFSNYHPVGSCRMGRDDDPSAVVDDQLRVRGVSGLRVFDASIMPSVPSAPTNGPTMAVADRAVALMMGGAAMEVAVAAA